MLWTDGLPSNCWVNIPFRRSPTRVERDQIKYIRVAAATEQTS